MKDKKLSVLILGYGAREHGLVWKIAQSPRVSRVFVAPGNAGTAQIATNVPISDEDIDQLLAFALENQIDLTVVGTNDPLALGAADAFQAAGLRLFGPTQAAAQLEASKAFAKAFMERHDIPTAAHCTFTDYGQALAYLEALPGDGVVVKVSGLGKMGQGVTVCDNHDEAREALYSYMVEQSLGASGQTVIIEERLAGLELSVFALSDGRTVVPLMAVRDHKRINDGDQGPNTGGMGAFGPPPEISNLFMADIMENIMQRTVDGMAAEGRPYVGVLYAGLMLTAHGVRVLEFNCRFGNPEALVIMPLLESDLFEAMLACVEGRLTPKHVQMSKQTAASVVLSSPGYPESYTAGLPIHGVKRATQLEDVLIFHHGTACHQNQLVTARGRVLAVTAFGHDLDDALDKAYQAASRITFEGVHYRRDIGRVAQFAALP